MTAPVQVPTPDAAVMEVFVRHATWDGQRYCLVCGGAGYPECDRCAVAAETVAKRREDI